MIRRAGVLFSLSVLLAACSNDRRGQSGNHDQGVPSDGAPANQDGNNIYGDLGGSDGGECKPGEMPTACANPLPNDTGCGATELCGTTGSGNGLDDNCDGKVDETCGCTPGDVQRCFLGPPGKRGIGACKDGSQTCTGTEFGVWGPCTGGISPGAEVCDGLDNDCNGCAEDGLCCTAVLVCPSSVPDAQPYTGVSYMGGSYFTGTAMSWKWTVAGGPCDQLFATTTGSPPAQSFTVDGGDTANPTIHFTLSGDYTVTMTVVDSSGMSSTCTFVQHVAGPGVRVELCWDKTGATGSDIDLHVHRPNSTTPFFGTSAFMPSSDDCNYSNCNSGHQSLSPNWGYSASPLSECAGGPGGGFWMNGCPNPRLDVDNITSSGVPENINIDNPHDGDSFRVLVHYYDVNGMWGTPATRPISPLVNIYCGGRLKTTYGQAPDLVPNFARSGQWAKGDMWRVADVAAIVDSSGVTTDCTVTALHPAGMTSGYLVGHDDKTSFDGN